MNTKITYSLTYEQLMHLFRKEQRQFSNLTVRWILYSSFGEDPQKIVIDSICDLIFDRSSSVERIDSEFCGITEIYHFLPQLRWKCSNSDGDQIINVSIPGHRLLNISIDDDNILISFMPHGIRKITGFPVKFPVAWGQFILVGITGTTVGKELIQLLKKILYLQESESVNHHESISIDQSSSKEQSLSKDQNNNSTIDINNLKPRARCSSCEGILLLRPLSQKKDPKDPISNRNFICTDCLMAASKYYEELEDQIIEQEQKGKIKNNIETLLDIIDGGITLARNLQDERLMHEFFMFRAFVLVKSDDPDILEEAQDLVEIVSDFAEANEYSKLGRNAIQLRKNIIKKKSKLSDSKIEKIESIETKITVESRKKITDDSEAKITNKINSKIPSLVQNELAKESINKVSTQNSNDLEFVMPDDIELDEDAMALGEALNYVPNESDLTENVPFIKTEQQQIPKDSNNFKFPNVSSVPEIHKGPKVPNVPKVSIVPKVSNVPNVPKVSNVSNVPKVSNVSNVPKVSNVPNVPKVSNVPNVPKVSNVPNVPKDPSIPKIAEDENVNEIGQDLSFKGISKATEILSKSEEVSSSPPTISAFKNEKTLMDNENHNSKIISISEKNQETVSYFQDDGEDDDEFAIPNIPKRNPIQIPDLNIETTFSSDKPPSPATLNSAESVADSNLNSSECTENQPEVELSINSETILSKFELKDKSIDKLSEFESEKRIETNLEENIEGIIKEKREETFGNFIDKNSENLKKSKKFENVLFFGVPKKEKPLQQEESGKELFQFFNLSRKLTTKDENIQKSDREEIFKPSLIKKDKKSKKPKKKIERMKEIKDRRNREERKDDQDIKDFSEKSKSQVDQDLSEISNFDKKIAGPRKITDFKEIIKTKDISKSGSDYKPQVNSKPQILPLDNSLHQDALDLLKNRNELKSEKLTIKQKTQKNKNIQSVQNSGLDVKKIKKRYSVRQKKIELCPMCGKVAQECTCGYMQMRNR
ncbi:hypothetical protein [Candidatus Harpocratesius sp.]